MKSRRDILKSRKATLLGGIMLCAIAPVTGALAADQMPVKGAAVAVAETGWYYNGTAEAGTNVFLQKPGSGFGTTSADPFWLTPSTTNSNAKMDEYGKVPRNVYLKEFGFLAGTKDGRFALDFWADNVGFDNQRYRLDVYEPGKQYFYLGFDQTPHLLSSSAKSIFGGVGSTTLTVDPAARAFLQANSNVAAQSQAQRNCIEAYLDGLANPGGCSGVFPATGSPLTNIELKTMRDKFTTGYRNTMFDGWDFTADYSHEHRTGTRPLGIGFGLSTTSANPRPSTGAVEVPQPLDDRTQIVNGAGEYVGSTPWGSRWNTSLKYMGSFFSNNNKVLDVQNPFCVTCNGTGAGAAPFGPNNLRYGLYADNQVNGVTWNNSTDIPIFKTRYTSTLQYMMFRQDDPFINTNTNGQVALAAYPRASLGGEVNAFLTNNTFYSHLTHDLTNTLKVNYYDRKDNTPPITFTNYAYSDTGTATTAPLTRLPSSYTKFVIEDIAKWQINRAWAFGVGPFFERFSFQNGEVDATNEWGIKSFVNWTPYTWLTARSSLDASKRRYGNWLAATSATDFAANAMRYFFVNNRDRVKGSTVVEVQVTRDIVVSPNGGLRWDNYPTDLTRNQTATAMLDTLGTKYDRAWNVGADLNVRLTPDVRVMFGYNHEQHYLRMESCCGGAAGGFIPSNIWSSNITQRYNTFIAGFDWKAIPGKLDFKVDYVAAISNEANVTAPCTSGANGCTGNNTTGPSPAFPDEHNIFQRFSVLAKYYVDPALVRQMGWFGDVQLKARYVWEQNRNTNWATDNFSPYSPSAADAGGTDISSGGKSLFLAYANPNYTAQIVSFAISTRW